MRGLALLYLTLCGGCGLFNGGGVCAVQTTPAGGILAYTGSFQGRNGQTVTGTALVYRVSGEVVIRLESLTAPSETGMKVVLTNSGGDVFSRTLVSTCGSMNIATGLSLAQTLASVRIDSTRTTVNNTYGFAALVSTIPTAP